MKKNVCLKLFVAILIYLCYIAKFKLRARTSKYHEEIFMMLIVFAAI